MLQINGVLALAVTALLVCCAAERRQDSEGIDGESVGRYEPNVSRQKEEYEDFLRFLFNYQNGIDERNLGGIGGTSLLGRNLGGIGGSSMLGRNLGGIGGSSMLGRNLGGIGGSSMLGRNLAGIGGSSLLGRNINGIGGSSLLGRDTEGVKRYTRFVDSLGGGNFVRNLDSIGGGNFVKKNLDNIGGPNLVKKHLDSLGGGNFVRELDSIGGGERTQNSDPDNGGSRARDLRETQHYYGLLPYLMTRRHDHSSMWNSGTSGKRELWPSRRFSGFNSDGYLKRNFDEIDLSGLNNFARKRNFDEIDHTWLSFPHDKRSYQGTNIMDTALSGLDKKRYKPDYPMDEIDLSSFPIGSKRSQHLFPAH